MKKIFIEPEIKRIELNLNENIASSEGVPSEKGLVSVSHGFQGCDSSVLGTDIPYGPHILHDEYFFDLRDAGCFIIFLSQTEAARMLGMPNPNGMN